MGGFRGRLCLTASCRMSICRRCQFTPGLAFNGTSLSRIVVVPVNDRLATVRQLHGHVMRRYARIELRRSRHLLGAPVPLCNRGVAFAGRTNGITDKTGIAAPAQTSASYSNTRVEWMAGDSFEYAVTTCRVLGFRPCHGFPIRRRLLIPGGVFTPRHSTKCRPALATNSISANPYLVVAKY